MPTTDHGRAIRDLCTEAMRDPASAARITSVLEDLRNGRGPRDYVDAVFQNWAGKLVDLDDAFAFGRIDHWVATGRVLIHPIHIGHRPFQDHKADLNNAILSTLPAPYRAEFEGGRGRRGGDGWLEWSTPITAGRHGTPGNPNDPAEVEVEPGSAILEVGTTAASRTYEWLVQNTKLARWPYDSEWITVFIPTIEFELEKVDALERRLALHSLTLGGPQ